MSLLMEGRNLVKEFPAGKKQKVHAVSDVSLSLKAGETLGLVGESGCGKSTLGKLLVRLEEPTSGGIFWQGKEISGLPDKDFRPLRRKIQMVFQDPYSSLDPRMTVRDLIAEPLVTWRLCPTREAVTERVLELMRETELPEEVLYRYPHQFSGGQRQRIGIARALATNPDLIICDEPVSALDVSVQNQILNLLRRLQKERNLAYLFISHDLYVVRYISDRVAVMFLGRICECGPAEEVFNNPRHPYTVALFNAIPRVGGPKFDPNKEILEGNIPSPIHLPTGCPFQDRCTRCTSECMKKEMDMSLHEVGDGHFTSCIHEYKL